MIRFRMIKINVDQFAILADALPTGEMSYSVSVGFKFATGARRIACEFAVSFDEKVCDNDQKAILVLKETCEFDIHPDDWDSLISDNKLTVTPPDLCMLANQTVGVARGLLYSKTENTPFTQFILPPINLMKLVTDDITVDFTAGDNML